MNKSRPAAPPQSSYYYNIGAVAASSHRRSRRLVGGLSGSFRRGEYHEQIEASSASEASYYYNIGAVAASSVGRVRVFGVASATTIEASSASEASDYYRIVAVAADSFAVLLVSPRRRAWGESSAWRTPRPSRPAAPQRRPTTTASSHSPLIRSLSCWCRHVDGLGESLRRGERHDHRAQQRLRGVRLLQHRRSRRRFVRCPAGVATSTGLVRVFGVANATTIEASSASEASYFSHIVAVAADTSAVLVVSPRRRAWGESSAWRTPRPSRPAAPQRRPTTTASSQSPPIRPLSCWCRHVDGLGESLRRGERHDYRAQQRLRGVRLLQHRRSRRRFVRCPAGVATSTGLGGVFGVANATTIEGSSAS
ncbi:hypothetical protein PF005_g28008 [Phytophthora fragariae]|uniref:Uncharacterized protein n=1 Tax=Phytophthora fragariae TaxID=53985 RepID=A0A6A3VPV4_9STRA|nr:hypothetical protein PF005_g28008 [Phytophthora fragariae]